jgi:hypothetical protein
MSQQISREKRNCLTTETFATRRRQFTLRFAPLSSFQIVGRHLEFFQQQQKKLLLFTSICVAQSRPQSQLSFALSSSSSVFPSFPISC